MTWSRHFAHMGRKQNITFYFDNPGGKRLFVRPEHRHEDIKKDLK